MPEVSLLVPDFTISAVPEILSLLASLSLLSFLFLQYFMASHPALRMPLNRNRKQRSQEEAEKERITSVEFFFISPKVGLHSLVRDRYKQTGHRGRKSERKQYLKEEHGYITLQH